MSKYKYIKEHNNYPLKLGCVYEGFQYNSEWIGIEVEFRGSPQLFRNECFERTEGDILDDTFNVIEKLHEASKDADKIRTLTGWPEEKPENWLQKLNRMKLEHPDAQIVVMVDENANNGEYSRMLCQDITVEFQRTVIWEGQYTYDEYWIKEDLACQIDSEDAILSKEEFEKVLEKRFNNFIKDNPWKDTIFVHVG